VNRGASLCRGLGLGLCLNLLLLAGCATPPVALHSPITSAMLVEGRPLTGGLEPAALPDTDILGVDPAMRHFITAGGATAWHEPAAVAGAAAGPAPG